MRTIPPKYKKIIEADPFMKKCVWTGETVNISWEHPWIYAGKQIVEPWATVPLARRFNTSSMPLEIKEYCRWIALGRAKMSEVVKNYPKFDWVKEKQRLTKKIYAKQQNSRA